MKARVTLMTTGQLLFLLLAYSNVVSATQECPFEALAIDTASTQTTSSPLITSAPLLQEEVIFRRQNLDCDSSVSSASSAASRSASAAIQQATLSAQQSIDAASRSITQAQQSAAQSASQAIQQAQQSASQASQSAGQAVSSANSVVSSVQSSASQAIASAESARQAAQQSASSAVLQAGAAVAAATGSAAAAGSSFLIAAAKATQGAQASASAVSAAAQSQIASAGQQVTASQVAAVTATQAAVAIVGSVIASSLLSILIYFLIARHRQRTADKRSKDRNEYQYDDSRKPPPPEKAPAAVVEQRENFERQRNAPAPQAQTQAPQAPAERYSLFPIPEPPREPLRASLLRRTSLLWNPRKPPPAPTLGSWLRTQEVSPFNVGGLDLSRNDSIKSITRKPVASEKASVVDIDNGEEQSADMNIDGRETGGLKGMQNIRWTDESVHSREEINALKSSEEASSAAITNLSQATTNVAAPIPILPRPGTAEWMKAQSAHNSSSSSLHAQVGVAGNFGRVVTTGLPQNPRMGLPSRPGPSRQESFFGRYDKEIQGMYEERLGLRSADLKRNNNLNQEGSLSKRAGTPGKAI